MRVQEGRRATKVGRSLPPTEQAFLTPVFLPSRAVPYRTTFIITNRAIEVEIEGANLLLSILTCGLWYMFFQSTTIEICELEKISRLYMQDDHIIAVVQSKKRGKCDSCFKSEKQYLIDLPACAAKTTREVVRDCRRAHL